MPGAVSTVAPQKASLAGTGCYIAAAATCKGLARHDGAKLLQ